MYIKGIGSGIIKRIDEILKSGILKEVVLEPKSDIYLKSITNLEQVYGIGREKAIELIDQYNIMNVKDLKDAVKNKQIDLPDNILIGLKYYGIYQQKISRTEMLEYEIKLNNILLSLDPTLIGIICGSYRRLSMESNDIDFLIFDPEIKTLAKAQNSNTLSLIIQELYKKKIIIDGLTSDQVRTKFMGFCKLSSGSKVRRIDIRFMPYESYATALLYFTGSGNFNKKMRGIETQMGYLLNEYGLYTIDSKK